MGLFTKIGELLSGSSTETNDGKNSDGHMFENRSNAVETRNMLKKNLLEIADSVYMANPDACKGKNIRIWVDDSFTYELMDGFESELLTYLSVERGYVFGSVDIREGKPMEESSSRIVKLGKVSVFVELKKKESGNNKARHARISIYNGQGKLYKENYELSCDNLVKDEMNVYNIGRGEKPRVDGGGIRCNHIVIDENECQEYNKYVSRAHAHIGYSETIGFYLQVEYGGSRISGSRTRIFRGNEKIELDNTLTKEPLHDGDLIELGKSVMLVYNEEKTF